METAFWLMIAVVSTAFIGFISFIVWIGNREKEREASFRSEMARRVADAQDSGPVLEYIRELERTDAQRTRTKASLGGLITAAVGVAMMIFLYQMASGTATYLVGLIPLSVGVVLVAYAEFMIKPDK